MERARGTGIVLAGLMFSLAVVLPPPASATYAGVNGPIVYMDNTGTHGGGMSEIWIMDGDGGNKHAITDNAVNDERPSISPDRSKIAFMSCRDPDGSAASCFEIHVMNVNGSNQTDLTPCTDPCPAPGNNNYESTWTPDSQHITWDGNNDIWTMDANGANQVNLTNSADGYEHTPEYSPDGTKLAVTVSGDHDNNGGTPALTANQIEVMNANGTGRVLLTNDANQNVGPTWSPDGSKIAWTTGDGKLWTMDADDGDNKAQVGTLAIYYAPVWSPDGTKIAARSTNGIVSVDLANPNMPTTLIVSQYAEYPSWAPGVDGGGDTTPPTVEGTSPLDGASKVSRKLTFDMSFSEAMDPASLTSAFTVKNVKTGKTIPVGVTMEALNDIAHLDPYPADVGKRLPKKAMIQVTLATGAQDVAGNNLAADYVFTFKTGKK